MLSAKAYSFRQNARLAISLSWIGGYTNVVALLACHSFVSHMTGDSTSIAMHLARREYSEAAFFAVLVGSFFCGAVASAFMTEGARRGGRLSKFVLPITAEAVLLILFAAAVAWRPERINTDAPWRFLVCAAAAMAMGLQNATITRISGSVVRTTHVTGVITDLGIEGVQFLLWWLDTLRGRWATRSGRLLKVSRRHPAALRVALLASILGSFLFGAFAGTTLYLCQARYAMLPPVAFLGWIIFMDWRRPIADVRELDLLSDPELAAYGIVKSMLPPGMGIYRFSLHGGIRKHRAPDFEAWAEIIPAQWRVIVLAITHMTYFDANAALSLDAAARTLQSRGKHLIIAGPTASQFRQLDAFGTIRSIAADDLCPDLEFAIARAIAVVKENTQA